MFLSHSMRLYLLSAITCTFCTTTASLTKEQDHPVMDTTSGEPSVLDPQTTANPASAVHPCHQGYVKGRHGEEQPCIELKDVNKRRKRDAYKNGCKTNKCAKCHDGFYGDRCADRCPKNCDGTCNKITGECDYACKENWGPRCEDECPKNCLDEGCNMTSGNCYGGCKNGWYGPICDQKCPKHCFPNICKRYSGKCMQSYIEGRQDHQGNMPIDIVSGLTASKVIILPIAVIAIMVVW